MSMFDIVNPLIAPGILSILSKDLIIFLSEIFNMNVLAKCLVAISLPILFLCENILLFLFIPDMFEPIVSYEDKNSIVNGFGKIRNILSYRTTGEGVCVMIKKHREDPMQIKNKFRNCLVFSAVVV